jgi:hypothetical protein
MALPATTRYNDARTGELTAKPEVPGYMLTLLSQPLHFGD